MQLSESPRKGTLKALLVEDNQLDADLLIEALECPALPPVELCWVERLADAFQRLESDVFDVILLDLMLPDGDSLQALPKLRSQKTHVPIIILTGLDDQDVALQALQNGAEDYLIKGRPTGESIYRSMRYAIERVRARELLLATANRAHEAEAHLKLALVSSQTGVWSWDVCADRMTWDIQVWKILGLTDGLASAHFKQFLELIHAEDRRLVCEAVESCLNGKEELEVEFRVTWKDGAVHYVSVRGRTFFDERGKPVRMTGVCGDITKHKQQEEVMKRLALLEQRQEFIAMLAHDLRTPVLGCQRIISLISDGVVGEISKQQRELLLKVVHSNHDMLDMITNLLESYRLESQSQNLHCTELNLCSVIDQCLADLMPIAQSGGVTIHTSCSLSRFVRADLIAMRRIINNLISNAIKFTRRGGRIDIIAFDRDGRATVQVKDTGIGITSEEMEHLFERFWQAKSKYRAKGVGLGLYLCYQLLRELDGTIRCESTPGSGTMFEISMPYHEQSTEPSIMPIKKLSHGLAASVSREVAAEQHKRGLLASSG